MRVALWAAVVLLGGWTSVRLLGLDGWYPAAQLIAYTPYVAVLAPVLALVSVLVRRWWAALVAGLLAVALAFCVLPRWLSGSAGAAAGPTLRVLTANVLAGSADLPYLVGLVRDRRVDLLAVQELTPGADAGFTAAGLTDLLPYRVVYSEPGVTGSGLYSRTPLRDDGRRENPCGFGQARAVLFDGVLVESVHPCAPTSRETTVLWRRGVAGQPPATVDGPVRLLLGDFNATLDHRVLRWLLATGYRDAADVAGSGLDGTWGPYDGDLLPPVTLDHVLADRRVAIRDVSNHDIPGSDHRAVYAELVLP